MGERSLHVAAAYEPSRADAASTSLSSRRGVSACQERPSVEHRMFRAERSRDHGSPPRKGGASASRPWFIVL